MKINDEKEELAINNPDQICSFTHFLGKDYDIMSKFESAFKFITEKEPKTWVGCIPLTK